MLLKEILKNKCISQNELAKVLQIDKYQMSKLCTYRCLPTPVQAVKMCEYLDCNILDIYNKKEIDLVLGTRKRTNNNDSDLYYRLSVRLNKTSCNCLKVHNLHKLGYQTQKEWILECMEDLKQRLKNCIISKETKV